MSDFSEIQVVGPLARAWDITLTILTRPFKVWVWVMFGLLVFVTTVGEYAWLTPSPLFGGLLRLGSGGADDSWGWALLARGVLFAVGVPLAVFFVWVRSRAVFCLYHSIAQREPMVWAGWKQYGKEADNYFKWSLIYLLFGLIVLAVVWLLAALFSLAGPDAGRGMWAAGFIGGICFLFVAFVGMLLESVIAPAMYLKRRTAPEVAGVAWELMIKPHLLAMICMFAVRMGIYLSGMFLFGFVAVFGCCCGWMPLLGTVVLLPIYLLLPVYALVFIDQFRPDFEVCGLHGAGLSCIRCGHDLLATPDTPKCPACGVKVPAAGAPVVAEPEKGPSEQETAKLSAAAYRQAVDSRAFEEKPEAIDLDAPAEEKTEEGLEVKDPQAEKKADPVKEDRPDAIDMDPPKEV